MKTEEIISYIRRNNGAETAALQRALGITYKQARAAIDRLVAEGELLYAGGVRYICAERRYVQNAKADCEIFRVPAAEKPRDADGDGTDEDELRADALRLTVESGTASVSMLRRSLSVSYMKACSLIDWMTDMGYVSEADGSSARRALVSREELDVILSVSEQDDEDEDELSDRRFAEYEKYLREHLSEIYDEEDDEEKEEEELSEKTAGSIFRSEDFENGEESEGLLPVSAARRAARQRLIDALRAAKRVKSAPVSADTEPDHTLWEDEDEFAETVMERLAALIRSDKNMGRSGALKKAENYLEAVRDTHDGKMAQVYERLVYELKNTTRYLYARLKRQLFE